MFGLLGNPIAQAAFAPTRSAQDSGNSDRRVYLPMVNNRWPRSSPFGVESFRHLNADNQSQQYIRELGGQWVRINHKISWRLLQPVEDGPIRWETLQALEADLRSMRTLGVSPVIVVDDHPAWAVQPAVGASGEIVYPSCGAIRSDKLAAFASFVQQLAQRYSALPYAVHHWEIGNEPDIDPSLVATDSQYGCWGDKTDVFYGGRHYGEMLKTLTPAVKAADPAAKIWVGGLLLDNPDTAVQASEGRPEAFLQGILEAGAGPYFDILAYHAYPAYPNRRVDADLLPGSKWANWGGFVLGKVRFLRSVMQQYGVEKPIYLNEISLTCSEAAYFCNPPTAAFYQAQADQLVRSLTRGLSENIDGFIWYSLEDPGWRHVGLLDRMEQPKPAYYAYKQLVKRLQDTRFDRPVDYGEGLEGYAFHGRNQTVHVLWAQEDREIVVSVPPSTFIAAYDLYGLPIACQPDAASCRITAGFSPVYIIRTP
ncbi:MAG: hypothetical protein ACOYYS_16565 [Chloroflexota bacterium]